MSEKDIKRALMVARKPRQTGGSYGAQDIRQGGWGPSSLDSISQPTLMGMRPDQLAKIARGMPGYEHLQQAAQDYLAKNPSPPISEDTHDILQRQDMSFAYSRGGASKDIRRALMVARAGGGPVPPFKLHSGAADLIEAKGQPKATPQQYAAMPGIKPDEIKHSNFSALGTKAIPREQAAQHLRENMVPVRETVLGALNKDDYIAKNRDWLEDRFQSLHGRPPRSDDELAHEIDDDSDTEYYEHQLPGGENYREVLLHLPIAEEKKLDDIARKYEANIREHNEATKSFDHLSKHLGPEHPEVKAAEQRVSKLYKDGVELIRENRKLRNQNLRNNYESSHWDVPNVLAHIRMSDRKGPNGEKVLHVEELQSDWGQQGREKGFKTPLPPPVSAHANLQELEALGHQLGEHGEGRVPVGPYVDNTQKWTDLALKRVLHEAAHGGYDKVVFTPGDEQNKRYDLSKHVSRLAYDKENEHLLGYDHNFKQVLKENVPHDVKEFARYIGKEPAEKLDAAIKAHEYEKTQFEPYKDDDTGRWHISDPNGEDMYSQTGYPLSFQRKNDAIEHINYILQEELNRTGSGYPEISGLDLKVGGSGMRGYYDNIMPKRLQALAQQHDPQANVRLHGYEMGRSKYPNWVPQELHEQQVDQGRGATTNLHSIDVTPQMRDSIKAKGFNQFKRGGEVEPVRHYADGGSADDPMVGKALDLVSMFQPAKPTMAPRVVAPSGEPTQPGTVSIKSLSDAFDKAIQHHTSLTPEDRAANSRAALQKIAPYLTKSKNGLPSPLLTKNAKLMKTEAGYKGGLPVSLPDGRGVETTGLALAPAYQEGKFTTCPNSASCKKECLGKFAGGYFYAGGGKDPDALKGPRLNSVRKTVAMLRDPEAFAVRLHDEIEAAKRMAAMNNNMLGVRLNVLSDINPRVHKAIINAHPDVAFYDYTKNNTNPIAPNHHYTYSSTGVSDTDVDNPHSNWKQMRKRLDTGSNVAMAFSHKAHLPETVFDEETGKRYKVVNGDSHDFRPLDIQPKGNAGVIVGLRNKKISSTNEAAHRTSNGFFVRYDPDFLVGNKGKRVKDMGGNPIAQNTEVRIRHQKPAPTLKNNDQAEEP